MAKARVRIELPPDFPRKTQEVEEAVSRLLKKMLVPDGADRDHLREEIPHRFIREAVENTDRIYTDQSQTMIEDVTTILDEDEDEGED